MDKVICRVCPLTCALREGQTGKCGVRSNRGGEIVYDLYGQVYPLYQAPTEIHFNHFLPGSKVLALGSLGCNLGCRMCHNNFQTQDVRQHRHNLIQFRPQELAELANHYGAAAIVFTYNDPVPQVEWVRDVASACKNVGIKVALCTAGFVSREYRSHLFELADAVELSLKGFYHRTHFAMARTSSSSPLETLQFLAHSGKWFEVTITVVPTYTDDILELRNYMKWHVANLGQDVPLRFAKFNPAHELDHLKETSHELLGELCHEAEQRGIRYTYVGNIDEPGFQTTFCPGCGKALIERQWFRLVSYNAVRDTCPDCQTKLPGVFATDRPVQELEGKLRIIEVKGPCGSSKPSQES